MRSASNRPVKASCPLLWAVFVLFVVLGAGCRTDVKVDIDVEEDGSGSVSALVELDREAAAAVLDLQQDGLALEDLFRSGWVISPPTAVGDGSIQVSATKAFGTPEQFGDVMAELSGEDALFGPFTLTRSKGFARVDYVVTGSIEPSGFESLADDELLAALGQSVTAIAARYGATPEDVAVSVRMRMPGTVDPELSSGTVVLVGGEDERAWSTQLDAANSTPILMTSATREVAALVWRGIAVVAAVLAVVVAFGHVLRIVRPERRRKPTVSPPPARVRPVREPAVIQAAEVVGDDPSAAGMPTVVALDGMGVLYREGDDINQLLVPFVRRHGSEASHDHIVARARALSLGRITPSELWTSLGLVGDANDLDDEYLSLFQLNPGVVRFLRSLRESGVRVACVTNDGTAWAMKLRTKHSLDTLIDPWVVSGAVGVRKPDKPIFEVLRRVTGVAPSGILVVDDDLGNLDAARALGFRTAWFESHAPSDEARGHAILRSFDVVQPVGD